MLKLIKRILEWLHSSDKVGRAKNVNKDKVGCLIKKKVSFMYWIIEIKNIEVKANGNVRRNSLTHS